MKQANGKSKFGYSSPWTQKPPIYSMTERGETS